MLLENNAHGTSYKRYFLPIVKIKDCNVMINGESIFDQPIKNHERTYHNIQKFANFQVDDYTTGCLLDYVHFKNYCKMIAIDLRGQQEIDADPKAVQQIIFTGILDRAGNTKMFSIIEESKETVFDFSQGTVRAL